MKLNQTAFIANITKVVTATKMQPSSGTVCAIASIMTVRDEFLASGIAKDDKDVADAIKAEFAELIQAIADPKAKLQGFCGNASAAAKAAGFDAAKGVSADVMLNGLI